VLILNNKVMTKAEALMTFMFVAVTFVEDILISSRSRIDV